MDDEDEEMSPPPLPSPTPSHSASPSDDDRLDSARDSPVSTPAPLRKTPAPSLPVSYALAVARRQALFAPASSPVPVQRYAIHAICTIPHATPVHALALPPCASHIFTGGSDGFVRRYALHATLNGTGFDSAAVPNLTMKGGSHLVPGELKSPVLVGYWENEETGAWMDQLGAGAGAAIKWGPKTTGVADGLSVVHSLAVQREELWGLSGTAHGSINLFTIRHDEGQIRHVFRSSGSPVAGHLANSPISVLTLTSDERSFLSGGWDRSILQWDLEKGAATRQFKGHTGQLSSISFRPSSAVRGNGGTGDAANGDVAVSPASSNSSSGVAASLVKNSAKPSPAVVDGAAVVASPESDGAFDPLFDDGRSSEADADGDEDDDSSKLATGLSRSGGMLAPAHPATPSAPALGSAGLPVLSDDVFLSTSIDGQVMLWDRRVKSGDSGGVRRLENVGKRAGWCTSACWSPSGNEVYVARRSASVEVYDIRYTASSSASSAILQTLRMPPSSGAVSAVAALPSGHHLVSASNDNIRVWDLDLVEGGKDYSSSKIAWKIIPGHHGATVSHLHIDPTTRFMISSSGNRGWEGTSSECVIVHEIKAFSSL